MKNYRNSDYAVNKFANGFVYRFADKTVEITLEDYLRENPGKTESDFAELKALSNEIYEEQARDENRQTYRNVSIHALEETELCVAPSVEEIIFDHPQQAARRSQRRNLAAQALATLTETQRRRYLLYHIGGLAMRKIAPIEGVVYSKIQKSIEASERKIKKFLTDG